MADYEVTTVTKERSPYECCGQVRDGNYCSACGRMIGAQQTSDAIRKKDWASVIFDLWCADESSLSGPCARSATLVWSVMESGAEFTLKVLNPGAGDALEELSVTIDLHPDGRLTLRVMRRLDGHEEIEWVEEEEAVKYQLWPLVPAKFPQPEASDDDPGSQPGS